MKNANIKTGDPDLLREYIEDRIISRSRYCQYAVMINLNSNLLHDQICNNCKSFVPTVSNELEEVKEEITISDDEGIYLFIMKKAKKD